MHPLHKKPYPMLHLCLKCGFISLTRISKQDQWLMWQCIAGGGGGGAQNKASKAPRTRLRRRRVGGEPLPIRLEGLEKRHELPAGSGAETRPTMNLVHLICQKNNGRKIQSVYR